MKELEKLKNELILMIKAKYSIIQIESYEEDRVISLLKDVAEETDRELYCWSITKGLLDSSKNNKGYSGDPTGILTHVEESGSDKAIYILKDYHKFIEDPIVTRSLRDLHSTLKGTKKTIVLTTPCSTIPKELEKSITILDMPYPGKDEFILTLNDAINDLKPKSNTDPLINQIDIINKLKEQRDTLSDKIANAGLGLTHDEFENVIFKCISAHGLELKTITSEKKQIIKKSGVLEYYETSEDMGDIGGLAELKEWVRKASNRFTTEAEKFGIEKPRGILLIGPPGTGKSLSAKAIAYTLQQPLLRLDMAGLSSKYYGETGNNVKQALKLADAVAPDVFWLDEIEKMFSTGQDGEGHEETMRAMGSILTHFEESTAPVFRVATSNSPFSIKPELMQRFEKVFFVDLPTEDERIEIFSIHLKKVGRDPKNFDLKSISTSSDGFVGREIRTIVKEALANAFDEGVEITTEHILKEISKIVPMATQKKEEIDKLRKWSKDNAIPASKQDPGKPTTRSAEI